MTTRHAGYIVTLKEPLREDDADILMNAICLLAPVASCVPVEANPQHQIATERARSELLGKVIDVLVPKHVPR
jgi:hypothetical protein